jgi:hypothetical protein
MAEPLRGLPERLPEGEHLLWQGAPDWRAVAVRAFHIRKVAIYFALLVGWLIAEALWNGGSAAEAVAAVAFALPLSLAAIAILGLLAWLTSRTTVYTITNRRLVMRFGITLPMSVNIPFAIISSADLKTFPDGTAEIPISLSGNGRLAYLALWPHARPGRVSNPEPMLRSVPEGARVAGILARALAVAAGRPAPRPVIAQGRETVHKPAPHGAAAAM